VEKLEQRGERFNQYEFKVDKLETSMNRLQERDNKEARAG
jgi:hypothetical protein